MEYKREYKRQLRIGDLGITKRTAYRHNINLNDNANIANPVIDALHQAEANNQSLVSCILTYIIYEFAIIYTF